MTAPVNKETTARPYASVAVPGPHRGLFTYRVPPGLAELAQSGHRVLVPFGRRRLVGLLWERLGEAPADLPASKIRDLDDVLDAHPVLAAPLRELAAWAARYYHAPLGELVRLAGPPGASWAQGPQSVRLSLPPEGETVDLAGLPAKVREVYYAALERAAPGESRTLRVAELLKRAGREALHHRLRLLERAGALSIEWDRPALGAPARERFVWEALPLDPEAQADLAGQAPKQESVWKKLSLQGPTETALLEEEIPGAQAALRGLLEKKLVRRAAVQGRRDPWRELLGEDFPAGGGAALAPPALTAAQAKALQAVDAALARARFEVHLLWGVTGSGKTEVYLRAIERALSSGRTAILLVPEIALTPLLAARFAERFQPTLAILHSGLSSGERHDEWQRLRSGAARVALGVRSALFAPVPNLGLLAVDEEHDAAYKQEESPAYHARDAAVKRAQIEGALCLLGSATPSLESLANARAGRYTLLELPERVGGRPFPKREIVDLRRKDAGATPVSPPETSPPAPLSVNGEGEERSGGGEVRGQAALPPRPWFLSERLDEEIRKTLAAREQSILFLNRRGFATTYLCFECGHQVECPHCAVRLRVHESAGGGADRLLCHYCGYEAPPPPVCEKCRGTRLRPAGLGTQQVEKALWARYPGARVARLDRDTVSRKGELASVLKKMARGELDILLGTQMVAKGHDFPRVTLVGVLLCDLAWSVPDFRAEERAWQQISQVAGRAGRGEAPGLVLLQTFDPASPLLARMGEEKLWEFAAAELETRSALGYPPAWRLAAVRFSAPHAEGAEQAARLAAKILGPLALAKGPAQMRVAGPAPAPLSRLRGLHRWQILLKARQSAALQEALGEIEQRLGKGALPGATRFTIDVDPQSLL